MKVALLVPCAVFALAAFAAPAPTPIPATETVAGLSQPQLTIRWWQWAASFSQNESPISDHSGARCSAGQDGPVWFLAGVFGSDPVQRTCHVPAGKALFFPVINYIVMPNGTSVGCSDNLRTARQMTDSPSRLFAEIDGQPVESLERHRIASPGCFNAGEKVPGHPMIGPSATDGYWLALAPLAPGRHQLHFGGVLPTLAQDVRYTLIVEAGSGSAEAAPASGPASTAATGTPAELAARARHLLDDEAAPDFAAVQAAVDEALRQDPHFSPALLQKARLTLMRGGESGESLKQAELLLQGARNNDFNYGPTYPLQGYVYLKLNRPGDAMQAFNRAQAPRTRRSGFPLLLRRAVPCRRVRETRSRTTSASSRFARHEQAASVHGGARAHGPQPRACATRKKADAAFGVLVGVDPGAAELHGDYARNASWFGSATSTRARSSRARRSR